MRAPVPAAALLALLLLVSPAPAQEGARTLQLPEPTVVRALAVAEAPEGFVGSVSTVSIGAAPGGSGHVFVDTQPLAHVDVQGSARLAVRVASAVTGLPLQAYDYFFVVRSDAPVIGGPSAGAVLTVGTIAAVKAWPVNQSVMMTGTINPDGDVGPIGGLLEKIEAAAKEGATLFLFPEGQENVSRLGAVGFFGAPQLVSVYDHCASLGIRCMAVGHVEEAVRHITGHTFEPRAPPGNVTSQDFLAIMRPLASNLTSQARGLVQDTSNHYDRAARSLPASLRDSLGDELGRASRAVVQAGTAYDEGRYYTASSRSYQASVAARYVDYALGLFEASDRDAYLRGRLDDADQRARQAVEDARRDARSLAHLEGLGAAQERATEAERAVGAARTAYAQGDALSALPWAAQARERSASVSWWLDIAERAGGPGGPLGAEVLNRTARDLLDTAREAIVYAQIILQEAGANPSLLSGQGGAADLLERAEADVARGFVPAAIFEAIQAEVRASAALELAASGPQMVESKLQRARERAAQAIVQARADGLEPVLAQSYFEFAGDLPDPDDALAFYQTARSVALLGHSFFAPQSEPRASRFVGFADVPEPPAPGLIAAAGGAVVVAASFALGLGLGAAVAIVLARSLRAAPRSMLPPSPPPPPAPEAPAPVDPFLEYGDAPPSQGPRDDAGDGAQPPELAPTDGADAGEPAEKKRAAGEP